jgi:hypothetical protein
MSFGTFFAALALIALTCLRGTLRSPFASNKIDADKDATREAKPRHSARQVSSHTIGTDILEGFFQSTLDRKLQHENEEFHLFDFQEDGEAPWFAIVISPVLVHLLLPLAQPRQE